MARRNRARILSLIIGSPEGAQLLMSDAVTWMRSSYCADTTCIEVSTLDGEVLVRDSKQVNQPVLRFSKSDWDAFLDAVVAGAYQA